MRERIDWHICMTCVFIAWIFTEIGCYGISNKIINFSDRIATKYIGKKDE